MEAEIATKLAQRVTAGDESAETELVARYSPGLRYLLRRVTGPPELVEDLLQETLRIVLERLRDRGLDDPAGLLSYLRGTARNLAAAERRRAHHRYTENLAPHAEPTDSKPGPAAEFLRAEENALVRRLIGELSTSRDREILYRFYVAEDEKAQICTALGLDETHFNRVLHRARQRFKDLVVGFEKRQRLQRANAVLGFAALVGLTVQWTRIVVLAALVGQNGSRR